MSETTVRYFVITLMLVIFVVFCAVISLAGPWYAVREQWTASNSTLVTRDSYYYLYRDISMQWTYADSVTGTILNKNSTRLSWSKSQMNEFGRVAHLCGPIFICAAIVDCIGLLILIVSKFSSSDERQYAQAFVRCCFSHRRRWILLFCGLLCTANILSLVSTLLFISSPTAFKHDIENREHIRCTTGPCVTWSGSAGSGNFFRNWGPSYAWYVPFSPPLLLRDFINPL